MQVERILSVLALIAISGKRERNTLVTYPELANNCWKRQLIRDIDAGTYVIRIESYGGSGEAYVLSASW